MKKKKIEKEIKIKGRMRKTRKKEKAKELGKIK